MLRRTSSGSEGSPVSASEPAEASALFERYFEEGNLDGLMGLYEDEAVFPTTRATATGPDEIRQTLKGYLDSGAKLVFGVSLVFPAGDLRSSTRRGPCRCRG